MIKRFCKRWKKTKVWRHGCRSTNSTSTSQPLLGDSKSSEKCRNWLDASHTNSPIIKASKSVSTANCFSAASKIHFSSSSSPAMSHSYSSKTSSERRCVLIVTSFRKAFQKTFTARRPCGMYVATTLKLFTRQSSLKFANKVSLIGGT